MAYTRINADMMRKNLTWCVTRPMIKRNAKQLTRERARTRMMSILKSPSPKAEKFSFAMRKLKIMIPRISENEDS